MRAAILLLLLLLLLLPASWRREVKISACKKKNRSGSEVTTLLINLQCHGVPPDDGDELNSAPGSGPTGTTGPFLGKKKKKKRACFANIK